MPCQSPLHKFTAHFNPVKTRRVPVGLPHEYAVESGFSYGILCQTRERHSKNFVLNIIIVSATFGNSRWHELTDPPPREFKSSSPSWPADLNPLDAAPFLAGPSRGGAGGGDAGIIQRQMGGSDGQDAGDCRGGLRQFVAAQSG